MKLTRLAPLAVAMLTLAGSAAFAQNVRFGYNVWGGNGMLTQPAIVGGSVLTQPAVVGSGFALTPQTTVIDNACGSCGVLSQPAVVAAPACGSCGVLEQPAVVGEVTPTIINQPVYLQGTNPYDICVSAGPALMQTTQAAPAAMPAPTQSIERRVITRTSKRVVRRARHHRALRCLRRR